MRHRYSSLRHCSILALFMLAFLGVSPPKAMGQANTHNSIDFFSGVDFNFRDINYNHVMPSFNNYVTM